VRAKEELVRLNVEAARLQAWVESEDQELARRASELHANSPLMSSHIDQLRAMRGKVNDAHRSLLGRMYALKGYTG
ncbi:hypothetical protein FA95DRAFT_1464554, partial [Auriscalpium vulgare]